MHYYLDTLLVHYSFPPTFHSTSFLEHIQQIFMSELEQLWLDDIGESLATRISRKEDFSLETPLPKLFPYEHLCVSRWRDKLNPS